MSDAPPDAPLAAIADYLTVGVSYGEPAFAAARLCLMDALACALLALRVPACTRLLGPLVPGATLPGGARVPGTSYELDPVEAAFDIGTMIRWLDYNDTWLGAEWGHPSDNLGGILATADWMARRDMLEGAPPLTLRRVLAALIQAYEIQGVLALGNSFNRVGLDHVILVRVATAAVVTALLGGTHAQVMDAVANAWTDGASLRLHRHAAGAGMRKSWAAGDATSRGVRLALMALAGETGSRSVLSAPAWGFCDVFFDGRPLALARPFGSHVIENVLFKVVHPAEFHAQTAVECALQLHARVCDRLEDIDYIAIETQEPALRIIERTGPLRGSADRDHCLQYMVAVALLHGRLEASDYEDGIAADPRIDALRVRTRVRENESFTRAYREAGAGLVGNAVQVFFRDSTCTERVQVEVPLGHPRRRAEALPLLTRKFATAVAAHFGAKQAERIRRLFDERSKLDDMPVADFMATLVRN